MIQKSQPSDVTIDYSQCAKEPITTLGAIQSHGGLLVIRSGEVVAYSKNIDTFLPMVSGDILHRRVSDVAPELSEFLIAASSQLAIAQYSFQPFGPWIIGFRKSENGTLHVEFFPKPTHLVDVDGLEEEIAQLGRKFHYPAKARSQFLNDVCVIFQKHLGFDQVFVQVLQDGEVMEIVAEANTGRIEPVLGLHFSSKEIPIQARELYMKQLLRFKHASRSNPVDIVSDAQDGIDLTHSLLREPSKFMTVYMQNISASTLLSTSIIIDRKLVALLTMHHAEPVLLDPRVFNRLVGVVQKVALELLRIDDLIKRNADSKLWELLQQEFPQNRLEALLQLIASPNLAKFLAHVGAVVSKDGKTMGTRGECPDEEVLKTIFQKSSNSDASSDFTAKLSEDFGLSSALLGDFAGLMRIHCGDLSVLFFRKSFESELKWRKSTPEGHQPETNLPRFSPSGSFQFLIQEVRDQSRPWSEKDIAFSQVITDWIAEDFDA